MSKESKISQELAEEEFQRFMDLWDVDTDVENMDADDQKSFNDLRKKVIREIKRERFVVHDDCVEYVLSPGSLTEVESLKFKIPRFGAVMGVDRYKQSEEFKKMAHIAGSFTGLAPEMFAKMSLIDSNFCFLVVSVFFSQ